MDRAYDLPLDAQADLDRFGQEIAKFTRGETSAAEFRVFRVPRGVYEQRESDTYMLRARCPAGMVLPHQMRALAAASKRYGNGVLHVTTRQDVQVHRVLLKDIHPALTELYAAGVSTKGGGGNTVRNITGCHDAGVCPEEVFDPSPYAVAVTEHLLPDPLSYQLPRKYKIAFSGCAKDCAGATVNDVGFVASQHGDTPGFTVYVGGGMGAISRVGEILEEFIPADEAHLTAEAVKRVFDQHGNRRNRHHARIRFLIEDIGLPRFRELYSAELQALRAAGAAKLTVRQLPSPACGRGAGGEGNSLPSPACRTRQDGRGAGGEDMCQPADFETWQKRHAVPQKQAGYFLVHVPLFLGDIEADRFEQLADLVAEHGEGVLRTTQQQNLVLRWIHQDELAELHTRLQAPGLAGLESPLLANMIACTGASTCRLGICLSRGLAKAIRSELSTNATNFKGLDALQISISGCPNSCGRHPLADIGLFGAARRANGQLVPQYVVQLGGRVGVGRTRLAQGQEAVPARNVPALVADILAAFRRSPHFPDFARFADAEGPQIEQNLVLKYQAVPDFNEHKEYYIDWDAHELFSLAGRGPGECGAGVFDLIEVDLESARDAVKNGRLLETTVLAARALLVTRGEQAENETEALQLFSRLFLAEGLVEPAYGVLIGIATAAVKTPSASTALDPSEVGKFLERIEKLYADMGTSLRFKPAPPAPAVEQAAPTVAATATVDASPAEREADFRGVICPLNYVKTKMVLTSMKSGSVLAVLLDEPGSRNVPASVEKDGHCVLSIRQEEQHWRVRIRKG
jgi:sulfite reductase (ferredoxin)